MLFKLKMTFNQLKQELIIIKLLSEIKTGLKSGKGKIIQSLSENKKCCIFCGAIDNLTREHVIPQWAFESEADAQVNSLINNHDFDYVRMIVQACNKCNNDSLSILENKVKTILVSGIDKSSKRNKMILIFWMQVIDYKLHVFNYLKKFNRYKGSKFIPEIKDLPMLDLSQRLSNQSEDSLSLIERSIVNILKRNNSKKLNSIAVIEYEDTEFDFKNKMGFFTFLKPFNLNSSVFMFHEYHFRNNEKGIFMQQMRKTLARKPCFCEKCCADLAKENTGYMA